MRELKYTTRGVRASDGAGVKLTRLLGTSEVNLLDPFLMLDAFESDNADDYIGGFPSHPHRGFETVTYMLAGRMRHKDSVGNEGVIGPDGVQWMTAGKGIIHSEMPEQEAGLLSGFQLWVNLPKKYKMCAPSYQEFPAEQIAVERGDDDREIRVIAGVTDHGTQGPVINEHVKPTYLDIRLPRGAMFEQTLPEGDNAFIYVITGQISVGEQAKTLSAKQLGILTAGDAVQVVAGAENARFLLVSGAPLNEPIARGGPFVMNTKAEIMQAFDDYQHNRF